MKSHSCILLIIYILFSRNVIKCETPTQESSTLTGSGPAAAPGSNPNVQVSADTTTDVALTSERQQEAGAQANPPQSSNVAVTSVQTDQPVVNVENQQTQEPSPPNNQQNGDSGVPAPNTSPLSTPTESVPSEVVQTPTLTNPFAVKSALLKDHNGLKITGPCESHFQVYLVPYLYINVNAAKSEIEMEQHSGMPITSMQVLVMTEQNKTLYVESKNYSVKNDIPEKCDALANDCFLSGILDVQNCYHCTLLMQEKQNAEECFKYISPEIRNRFDDIKTTGQDEDDADKVELEETIDNILKNIYKNEDGENKLINKLALADNFLKQELLKYCKLLKETDTSGTFDNHEMANEEEVFTNLTNMIEMNSNYDTNDLKGKLKNVAICMHNPNEWVSSKTGLLLPVLSHNHSHGKFYNYDNNKGSTVMFKEGTDGIKDFTILESVDVSPSHMTDKLHCNDEFCDRTKDTTSCMSKIEAEDQGNCALSWIFASKFHLESTKCMKGYKHVPSSALYVANCSSKGESKCHSASNPLEFLNTVDGNQFLPSASDMPYSYKLVGNVCPKPKNHWTNLWNNIKLLNHENVPNSVGTKGYTAYQSEHFKNNMDEFIKIVKSEIMKKGSVIAYVKAKDVLNYNFNGKVVHFICGAEEPDLAVNLIGYGNYINGEGQKKSYWLLRNSWGKYWGDKGNFKVDMVTPDHCQHNFIHTAAVFNLDIPQIEITSNKGPQIHNYYMKNSPDFYNNLYFQNFPAVTANDTTDKNESNNDSLIFGESDKGISLPEVGDGDAQPKGQEEVLEVEGASTGVRGGAEVPVEEPAPRGEGTETSISTGVSTSREVGDGPETAPAVVPGSDGSQSVSVDTTQSTTPSATGVNATTKSVNGSSAETISEQTDSQEASPTRTPTAASPAETTLAAPSTAETIPVVTTPVVTLPATSSSPESPASPAAPIPKAPLSSTTGTSGVNVTGVTGVLHFLKNVKNGKVKSSLVTYNNKAAIGDAKVCSRAHSSDVEKIKDCIKFCEDKWDECKGTVSPGYCLAKKKGNNDCFFCFV
ncbi:serine-repeat antigen 3c [Plasmodium gonderi]|uniref:Serine-repeat antigen 3c n=1 Tax=Plasmodium gonderi TaxID=77519 RepID=A0A1Y1JFL2_PLAGO|nr:serine-repeat antigen 3c [Plasmodium gonderi]GAW79532.1 serine-repeat antigen 3c [Plasmodium gonderi]